MRLKLLFVLLAITTASFNAGCQQDKKNPTQKEQAVKQWKQARATVLASLARSQYEAGDLDKSQQTVTQALTLDPDSASLHVLKAKLSIEQGQLEQADRELTVARKLDEKNAEAEYLSGVVYQRWQKSDQAYECYLRASQKDPHELAYVLARAETLVAMNCADEAISVLRNKTGEFEHNAVLHHSLGQLLVDQGRYPEGIKSLRQAILLSPEDGSVREHLAMAYFYNRQYQEAGELFARIVKDDKNAKRAELWVALGECRMQLGRTGDARSCFDTATQVDPSMTAAWLSLGKAALQLGDTRRAESVLRKALSLDANLGEAHLLLGYIRLKQNKLSEAMSEFQKASALDRTDPVSLCMIGFVLEKSGKPQQAVKYYAQALKIKPDDELAAKLMASIEVQN